MSVSSFDGHANTNPCLLAWGHPGRNLGHPGTNLGHFGRNLGHLGKNWSHHAQPCRKNAVLQMALNPSCHKKGAGDMPNPDGVPPHRSTLPPLGQARRGVLFTSPASG